MSDYRPIYPQGVPYRIPRPRTSFSFSVRLFGCSYEKKEYPLDFDVAVSQAFDKHGAEWINRYSRGLLVASVLFRDKASGGFWTIKASAPEAEGWTKELADDWLYGELVFYQLPKKIKEIRDNDLKSWLL